MLSSCEDFLTETNPNELSGDLFWANLDDAEKGLIAVYNQLRSPDLVNQRLDPARSDFAIPVERKKTAAPTGNYYQRIYNSGDGDVVDKWRVLYTGIYRANQVIEGLAGIEDTTLDDPDKAERWKNIMAQARFLRGLFHYWAYLTYNNGSVIIVDKTPGTNEEEYYRSLSSPEEVRDFFRADLEFALNDLPETWEGNANLGRPTKGTAAAYLGQSYLYEAKYTNGVGAAGDANFNIAKAYFEEVFTLGYNLVEYQPDGSLCTTQDEFNNESIFEIVYDTSTKSSVTNIRENTSTWAAYFSLGAFDAFSTIVPSYSAITTFKNDPIDLSDSRNKIFDNAGNFVRYRGNTGALNPTHINRVNLRLSLSIAIVEDEDKLFYGNTVAERANNNTLYGAFRKFNNWDILTSEVQDSGVNHRLMRLSDVYLMYAECLLKGGSDDSGVDMALKYVNRIRKRAALELLGSATNSEAEFSSAQYNDQVYTASSLMNHIMYKERPLELCLEGYNLRFFDLRRWDVVTARFKELALIPYHLNNPAYVFINELGNTVNSASRVVNQGEHPTSAASTLYEYVIPAANNIESIHNYYPIPTNESGTNPNIP